MDDLVGIAALFIAMLRALIVVLGMSSNRYRYRKHAEECLDRAARARKPEDSDAWLSMAEDWIRLAVESEAERQPRES